MYKIDLSGVWRYETDENNIGCTNEFYKRTLKNDGFTLPGSACENRIGKEYEPFTEMTRETVRCLRPRYDYVGALWLQREIDIPKEFTDKHITLFMERVNIASELWIDGVKAARQTVGLSTPHIYNLSGKLNAGRHIMTLRIDNSNLLNIDGMSSGYSVDTQSLWLGIIGKIELRAEDILHISNIQIFPHKNSLTAKIVACSDCSRPHERKNVTISLQATAPDGTLLEKITYEETLCHKKQILRLEYPMNGEIRYWDEFHPDLYTMTAELEDDKKSVSFGMREIRAEGRKFMLNDKPISLRGTLECALHPLTGYPPTELEPWLKIMQNLKEYGLNHIRFHAWCPPESAFLAADMTGIYVLAEMPLWLNTDVCKLSAGDDIIHKYYFSQEMIDISNTFGNHPSFIMFSNGNELLGDFELLENMTTQIKALDNRRLYTLTSNFDRTLSPADDYFSAVQANGHRVRVQVFHDVVSEHTRLSYDDAINSLDIPLISFETGQYCVYPNVDSVSDYSGNLLPANFEVIGAQMKKCGLYPKLKDYIYASGKLAALMYKEEIEAALRTHGMGGFELLGLWDHTGQGTATVGLLDVFGKNKGIISPEEFREFCSHTVPLMKADRVFENTDIFTADFDLYDHGEKPETDIIYSFELKDGNTVIYQSSSRETGVSFPLDAVKKPTRLTARLSVGNHSNHWNVFVYPKADAVCKIPIIHGFTDELEEIIESGKKAIVTADNLKNPIEGIFKPAFWSPAHFPTPRACGFICDSAHPIFADFPTENFADFQWKHPIDNSVSADISDFPRDFPLLMETVPNFFDNTPRSPLFEAKIENADILFCGFNLNIDKKTVNALKNSIYNYVSSEKFSPRHKLSKDVFKNLFK